MTSFCCFSGASFIKYHPIEYRSAYRAHFYDFKEPLFAWSKMIFQKRLVRFVLFNSIWLAAYFRSPSSIFKLRSALSAPTRSSLAETASGRFYKTIYFKHDPKTAKKNRLFQSSACLCWCQRLNLKKDSILSQRLGSVLCYSNILKIWLILKHYKLI